MTRHRSTTLVDALNADPGVALAAAPTVAKDATVAPVQVYPEDVTAGRGDDRPAAPPPRATSSPPRPTSPARKAYVGGFQAVTVDFTQVLADALPWFLLIVVGLGFLALVVLFRSLLVPLTGVLCSLLSLGAALGITVAVFQWGWFADLVQLQATGPIFPFLPVMVFSILFGLSATTRCSWSAACTRSGSTPVTTARPSVEVSPGPARSSRWPRRS